MNDTLHQIDLRIYTAHIAPKIQNIHYFQKHVGHSKDRPHGRTQNKPKQIQEN